MQPSDVRAALAPLAAVLDALGVSYYVGASGALTAQEPSRCSAAVQPGSAQLGRDQP